jgi:hypothetical protein
VGRGWSVPADPIEQPVRDTVNQLAGELGYVPVDQAWSIADTPPDLRAAFRADLRAGHGRAAAGATAASAYGAGPVPRAFSLLGDRLQAGLFRVGAGFQRDWGACAEERFLVTATAPSGDDRVARWRVDLAARTVTPAAPSAGAAAANERVSWQLTGSAACWEHLLAGTANLNVALRRRELRYADTGTAPGPVTVQRVDMLSDLLGITCWSSAEQAASGISVPAASLSVPAA